jgi:hypothetical protein
MADELAVRANVLSKERAQAISCALGGLAMVFGLVRILRFVAEPCSSDQVGP